MCLPSKEYTYLQSPQSIYIYIHILTILLMLCYLAQYSIYHFRRMCTICNITYGKEVECENIDPRALISTPALRASVDIQPDDMIMILLFGLLWHIPYFLALSFTTGLHNHHKILLLQYYMSQFSPFRFRSLLSA